MRGRIVPTGAALLAACGSGQPVNQAEPVAAAPAVSTPAAPAERAAAAVLPGPFVGVYDATSEDCGRPSDARLTVTPGELRFHESIGTVRKVTATGADSVSVEADYQGEGERWRNVRELRLTDGGAGLTVSGEGTSLARIRCPAGTG